MVSLPTEKYLKWLDNLGNKIWVGKIQKRIENIENYGRFGNKSHKCEAKNDIYELVFEEPIRVYFTMIDKKTHKT